jgi:hypothetical protein
MREFENNTINMMQSKRSQNGPGNAELQVRWMQRELIRLLTEAATMYDAMESIGNPTLRGHLDSATDQCLQALDQLSQLEAGLNQARVEKQVESA